MIIVLSLVSGGALMLMGPPIEIAQVAYRTAGAEMRRLTAQGLRSSKLLSERRGRMQRLTPGKMPRLRQPRGKLPRKKLGPRKRSGKLPRRNLQPWLRRAGMRKRPGRRRKKRPGLRRHAEWLRLAQARAAAQEAAKRQAAEDARLKTEQAARKAAEGKPKSDAEVRGQAERADAGLKLSEQDRKRVQVALTRWATNSYGHGLLWPTHPGDDHGLAKDARAT